MLLYFQKKHAVIPDASQLPCSSFTHQICTCPRKRLSWIPQKTMDWWIRQGGFILSPFGIQRKNSISKIKCAFFASFMPCTGELEPSVGSIWTEDPAFPTLYPNVIPIMNKSHQRIDPPQMNRRRYSLGSEGRFHLDT